MLYSARAASGDPGIYAMAGLVLELCRARGLRLRRPGAPPDPDALGIEIVPGIPALAAGAALLGAPLTHDFAAVSLSDLLTPWEAIEERLEAAARVSFWPCSPCCGGFPPDRAPQGQSPACS